MRCLFPSLQLPGVDGVSSNNFIRCMLEKGSPLDSVCRDENFTEDIAIRIVSKEQEEVKKYIDITKSFH